VSQAAVLVMAYGGPDSLEEVEPYLLDVRGGRALPPPALAEVKRRYQSIGGRSPILDRTVAQARALRAALDRLSLRMPVYVGMRHWHPRIEDTVASMASDGVRRIIGLVMAPHYSRLSVELYFEKLDRAAEAAPVSMEIARIQSWKDDPGYLSVLAERTRQALGRFADGAPRVELVFTAHSLPERILEWNDPYPQELAVTFEALRAEFPQNPSTFAYQSAGMTPEPWLQPDVRALLEARVREGARHFLVVPFGFVSEHVEILYDVDIDLRRRVEAGGGRLERIEMPGADPRMMTSLAGRVRQTAEARGWL
jgi:ferrochelatase